MTGSLLLCLGLALCPAPPLADAAARAGLAPSSAMPAAAADAASPPGFAAFCLRFGAQCQPQPEGSAVMALDADAIAALGRINRSVNRAIRPLDDSEHYGRPEFWTIPADGYGDCEDYALAKRAQLIALGIPAGALRLAIALTPRNVRHAVLTVSTASGDYVLDNLHDDILPWNGSGYRWILRQKAGNPRRWTFLAPQGEVLAASFP